MNDQKRFSISERLLDAVVQYLGTKPFNEVAGMVSELQKDIRPIGTDGAEEEKK